MRLIARPIVQWPGEFTARRQESPFWAAWTDTVDLLGREVRQLGGDEVVMQLAITETDLRRDGQVYAGTRPAHPGVIISFDSRLGPLRYHTDQFESRRSDRPGWQANVRAIALGLDALRRVDRYGISHDGEQYRGWQALPPGRPMGPAMTVEEAARLIAKAAGVGDVEVTAARLLDHPEVLADVFRLAAKHLHPDQGGDPDQFRRLVEARDLIEDHR